MSTPKRKPRIALMGEFSAGKSTLSNLLLGARPLPEKVTATRLSPVWMSYGNDAPYRVDVSGAQEPVALDQLEGISVDETRVIRLFFEADVLQMCDLIDFPGISDPNMSSDVWQRMLNEVDAILWCTHATQAWRQSESAVWETIPDAAKAHSALLITRFDKLTTERDERRVLARIAQETAGQFAATFPISLTDALAAGDDFDAFEASGGIDFLQYFLSMAESLATAIAHDDTPLCASRVVGDAISVAPQAAAMATPVPAPMALPETVALSQPVAAPETIAMPEPIAAFEAPEPITLSEPAPLAAVADTVAPAEVAPAPVEPASLSFEAPPVAEAPTLTAVPEPAADPNAVTPRRVRPQGRGSRRPRPAGSTKNFDMASLEQAAPAPLQQSAAQLRAVFQEAPDTGKD